MAVSGILISGNSTGTSGIMLSCPMGTQRLWPSNPTPDFPSQPNTQGAVSCGVCFKSDVATNVKGAYIWVANTLSLPTRLALVNSSAAAANIAISPTSSQGWQRFDFPTPIAIPSGTYYEIFYHEVADAGGNVYFGRTEGGFPANLTVGHITAYSNTVMAASGFAPFGSFGPTAVQGQGNYEYNASTMYTPFASFGVNYWIDPIIEISSATSGIVAQG